MATGALYVYGIVDGDRVEDLPEGVGGAPVETLEEGGLSALVSPAPEERVRLRRRELRRHLGVIERAFAAATILPCPFGTVVADEQALRAAVFGRRSQELRRALDRLRGRAQLNVKAQYDEQAVLREIVRDHPAIGRLRDETRKLGDAGHFARIRLGEVVAEALQSRRADDARRIVDLLRKDADEFALDDARDELTVVKASFLVHDAEGFDRTLEELAEGDGGRIRYESIGPLPPTAFAAAAAGLGG